MTPVRVGTLGVVCSRLLVIRVTSHIGGIGLLKTRLHIDDELDFPQTIPAYNFVFYMTYIVGCCIYPLLGHLIARMLIRCGRNHHARPAEKISSTCS